MVEPRTLRAGEPRGGATERWLQRLAATHRIYIGASYLEADGDDFFNTFSLAAPDGSIAGRVRKESLPGVIVADVKLEPSRKRMPEEPKDAYWSRPPRVLPRIFGAWFVAMENMAKRVYAKSAARRTAARSIPEAHVEPKRVEASMLEAR